jgi:uncharacterized membrane protein
MPRFKRVMSWLLGVGFVLAGANHFLHPGFYLRMMPPSLPWHLGLVYLSGVFEVALGALLLVPRCAPLAAWGIIALLIAVFPANVYMALNPERFPEFSSTALYCRLPIQGILIAWAYWFTGAVQGANGRIP